MAGPVNWVCTFWTVSKRDNSTKRPEGGGFRTNVRINAPIDFMHPEVVVQWKMVQDEDVNYLDYNYLYLQHLGRYYWIESWTWREGMLTALCKIDCLASWRNYIGNLNEYVLRSADIYDPSIVDTLYPLTGETKTLETKASWYIPVNPENSCYVIGIVSANGLVEYYLIDDLASFGAAMFGEALWNEVTLDDPGRDENAITFMRAQFNPLQYVVSCIYYPFEITAHSAYKQPVYFGYFDSGFTAYTVSRNSIALYSGSIAVVSHPQAYERGYYLNLAPFTRLRLSALPFGEIDLDTTKFALSASPEDTNAYIHFKIMLDAVSGSAKLEIYNSYTTSPILTLIGSLGATEQISQVLRDNLATVTGATNAIAGGIGNLLSGNIGGAISSVVSGIGNAVSAQYPDVSTTGVNGSRISLLGSEIRLVITYQMICKEDREELGRPLCMRTKIGTLSGYMLVSDPAVEIPATRAEIEEIRKYMSEGFFYE